MKKVIKKEQKLQKIQKTPVYAISKMTRERIDEIKSDPRQFNMFIIQNKGFLNSLVLLFMKKDNPHYEDMFQEACIGLFKALDKFDPNKKKTASLSTFAYGVIKNDLIQQIKKLNKTRAFESSIESWRRQNSGSPADPMFEYSESHWQPLRRTINVEDEVVDRVAREQHLNKFSDTERRIIILRQQGYKMKEIADILKKNLHSVRSIYFYASKKPEFQQWANEQ